IDVVQTGLKAQVTLTAFKQRTTPTLDGRVSYVSADSLTDPRTGLPYFSTRIEIPADEMERLGGLELNPGMPAQVMIVTGERTAFQYLFDPLRESLQRAFREQ
ncbi:MAG: HlyD family secretion protein, partial [Minwuiales bacterium]|nr:HlyD family secretion protein [Minwuiales bacterium]